MNHEDQSLGPLQLDDPIHLHYLYSVSFTFISEGSVPSIVVEHVLNQNGNLADCSSLRVISIDFSSPED